MEENRKLEFTNDKIFVGCSTGLDTDDEGYQGVWCTNEKKKKYFLRVGETTSEARERFDTNKQENYHYEKAYGFASKERRETKHHIDHAKKMGYKNQKEYERAAVEFFNGKKGELYYSQARKRWYKYDEKTELLCVSSEGIIHTFSIYSKNKFNKIKRQDKLDER